MLQAAARYMLVLLLLLRRRRRRRRRWRWLQRNSGMRKPSACGIAEHQGGFRAARVIALSRATGLGTQRGELVNQCFVTLCSQIWVVSKSSLGL